VALVEEIAWETPYSLVMAVRRYAIGVVTVKQNFIDETVGFCRRYFINSVVFPYPLNVFS
jgi:hypothetical protein